MTARVETCGGDVAASGAISSILIAGPHGSCFNTLSYNLHRAHHLSSTLLFRDPPLGSNRSKDQKDI